MTVARFIPMKSSLCLALAIALAGSVLPVKGAQSAAETGARLLQAQLPAGTTVPQADCEQLARAVGRATLAHRVDAPAILSAVLGGETGKAKRPCACVTRIFRVAVAAAPTRASALLETASALYPDCADALAAALNAADDKNAVDAKDGPKEVRSADAPSMTRDFGDTYANDPATADLSDRDFGGLGFGGGFGPGFPGSPGFIGSPASGGIALPAPVGAVTPVVNG